MLKEKSHKKNTSVAREDARAAKQLAQVKKDEEKME